MAFAILFAAVMVFAIARPVAASNRYWATGTDVRITLNVIEHCNLPFTYPANTPFYIMHGWAEWPWVTDSPANKSAFMGPAMYFEFRIDGVLQKSTMVSNYLPAQDMKMKLFVSESDHGLTGTHDFYGAWYYDAWFDGGTRGVPVLGLNCELTVTFV